MISILVQSTHKLSRLQDDFVQFLISVKKSAAILGVSYRHAYNYCNSTTEAQESINNELLQVVTEQPKRPEFLEMILKAVNATDSTSANKAE